MQLMNTIEIDLQEVEEFVISDKFRDFLLTNTVSIGTAAFVLQVVLNKIDECRKEDE